MPFLSVFGPWILVLLFFPHSLRTHGIRRGMGPKRAHFKPPIRPKADGTGFVRTPAGGANKKAPQKCWDEEHRGATTCSSLDPCTESAPVAQGKPWVGLLLQLRSDGSLPSNEARLSPLSFNALGIASGGVLRIEDGKSDAYVEAFLSSSCHSQSIILADEMAAVFGHGQVTVTVITPPSRVMPLSLVALEIRRDPPGVLGAVQAAVTLHELSLQVRAAFRRQYQHRLVFQGMRAIVRIATHPYHVEVVRCLPSVAVGGDQGIESDCEQVVYGVLMDSTATRDGCRDTQERVDSVPPVRGVSENLTALEHVLVVGDPGTGKSRLLHQEGRDAATSQRRHVEVISVEELSLGEMADVSTSTVLREAFARSKVSAPSTVIIDDLHLICGAEASLTSGSLWAMELVAAALGEELDDIRRRRLDVCVIASAVSVDAVSRSLVTPVRFSKRVTMLAPGSVEERRTCLKVCLEERGVLSHVSDSMLLRLAEELHGFTQRDFVRLVEVARVEAFKATKRGALTDAYLREATKVVRPSALRQFEVSVPRVTWDDIGGSETAKKALQDCVAWCLGKQQWVFRTFNLSPPKGVLLYGPPGCSKTMLAKALANESKMNFISVKGPEVFSKWVGDSEKAVRDIFTRARAVAPCVVFIDELDGMCTHRGRGGVSDRVVSQFLTELDGLPAALDGGAETLVFVAATNRPDNIDPAVLRPGRIDRKVYVGLPDLAERRAIVHIHFCRIPVAPDLDADYVACQTDGYSGAEVVAVVKEAAFLCVTANSMATHVTRSDIDEALQKVKPRISPGDVEWYKQWSLASFRSVC